MIHGSFAGNVGRDAEVRNAGGTPVCGFSVAVTMGFGDKQTTQWVNCSLWGKRAESVAQYLTKGKQVTVWGQLSLRSYEGKSGPATSLECRVDELKLHKGADAPSGQPALSGRPDEWKGSGGAAQTVPAGDFDNDPIPFAFAYALPAGLLAAVVFAGHAGGLVA